MDHPRGHQRERTLWQTNTKAVLFMSFKLRDAKPNASLQPPPSMHWHGSESLLVSLSLTLPLTVLQATSSASVKLNLSRITPALTHSLLRPSAHGAKGFRIPAASREFQIEWELGVRQLSLPSRRRKNAAARRNYVTEAKLQRHPSHVA